MTTSFIKRPRPDATEQIESPVSPLSALEISGAICSRVIHDLSNLVSGVIGNAEYAQGPTVTPENLQKALQAISQSANTAGKLLGQCLPLQVLVSNEAAAIDTDDMARRISESAGLAPGWRAEATGHFTGQIRVQPRWFAAAVWQLAREAAVARGEIKISCGPAMFPVVWRGLRPGPERSMEFFQVTLHYRAEQMLSAADGPVSPDRFGLVAVHELIRRFRGQIHPRAKPPGRQEITILLPMVRA
jgi:hypothetical protein